MTVGGWIARIRRWPPAVQGAFWMVVQGTAFSLMSACIRAGSEELSAPTMIFARNLLALLILSPLFLRQGVAVLAGSRRGLAASLGVLQIASNVCWFVALATVSLGDVTALSFLQPVIVPLLAVFVLREVLRPNLLAATMVGFAGALLIIRPGFAELHVEALLVVGSAVTSAFYTLVTRSLYRDHHPNTIVLYTLLCSVPLAAALAVPAWTWPSPTGWLWLLAIGLSAAVGQFTMTLAYGAADTALVMPFDFLRLPITALIAFVAFAEVPDLWTWIGAVVIFGSSVYVVRRGR